MGSEDALLRVGLPPTPPQLPQGAPCPLLPPCHCPQGALAGSLGYAGSSGGFHAVMGARQPGGYPQQVPCDVMGATRVPHQVPLGSCSRSHCSPHGVMGGCSRSHWGLCSMVAAPGCCHVSPQGPWDTVGAPGCYPLSPQGHHDVTGALGVLPHVSSGSLRCGECPCGAETCLLGNPSM